LDYINEIYKSDNPILELKEDYEVLGKQINKFIQYVEKNGSKLKKQRYSNGQDKLIHFDEESKHSGIGLG
jgi:hypothetical protein